MVLDGFFGMMNRMQMMPMRGVRVMGCFFMLSCFVKPSGFMVVLGGGFVMLGGLAVVFRARMFGFSHKCEYLN